MAPESGAICLATLRLFLPGGGLKTHGGAAAYRGYSAVRFGSPEKAQCAAGHYQRVSASRRSPDSV
ncbi:TPA: hypothetical protein MIP49_17610 [Klebsiella pneumoniae]|nr:hypothetical protein [Klebsiella pneumoniae]